MSKRFTDTNKYKKHFIRGLPAAYKLLWDYLYHDCDHAGIWVVDFEIAQIYLGSDITINYAEALSFFNSDETRILEISGGKKWFIPSFVEFQYGELNPLNRAHASVISVLKKEGVGFKEKDIKPLISPLQGCKDKDKDIGVVKDVVKGKDVFKEERIIKERDKIPYQEIIENFNFVMGTQYRSNTRDIQKLIKSRWDDGFKVDDFIKVHQVMKEVWGNNPKMKKFLRPHTLYTEKFQSYLNYQVSLSDRGIVSEITEHNLAVGEAWLKDREAQDVK